ncbi:hypothetical protein CMV24_29755 [Pseudomonas plecoglossicida]|uniref:Uncharacterized protein n=2 Tax=Pseudomonas TaxID=286 RepID=A0A2A3LW51_PSEDL|nr:MULTISPECIES: hypothetical protein [Pseudomonas]HBO8767860.1 hypothetical protein [Pseudomonas aeruginosa]EKT4481183.1 hypothetical protein [Pseudomonas putida]MBA6060549.1 hypothetical protein [Pseudomonas juntendi]PBJ91944.1 hypothetical protein CMV24_29755 [Pseudomonas plecoglossicida]UBM27862.1 hypothetical protein K8374_25490 [Pseudomonas sp. p1(2021b)]
MLNLVTDQRPGEPDVLSAVKHAAFEIRSLAGDVLLAIAAPPTGWTHQQLITVAYEHVAITRDGADGYLGGEWIGSSEI